ncbi:MAG TPA: amino acid adenylation domain-containing protein, partial [Pyrinomonadaceae bacterium]|nr:amino acid adenylation domain-containing protein [Pyrinomonadaceae bacterium]
MNPKNIENIFELSPLQQGMLFHTLYAGKIDPYVYQYAARLKGELQPATFRDAWQATVDRHQSLRTAFYWQESDKPLQVAYKEVEIPFEEYDWRGLPAELQEKQLEDFFHADRERGFEFSVPPLMRLTLIRIDDETCEFIWSFHHILLDGWSVPLVLKDVFDAYDAFCRQDEPQWTNPEPYRNYIGWLQKQDLAQAERFWRQTLKGFTGPTKLPQDKGPRSAVVQEDIHDAQVLDLSEELTSALQQLARQRQLTVNTLVQAAWGLLLARYSGQSDVVFGAVVSGRPPELAGVETMVGLFINTLPLRLRIEADGPVTEWLKALQLQQIEARKYDYSPLVQVQGWSEVPRRKPMFETLLAFENFPGNGVGTDGSLQLVGTRSFERNSYPLSLIVWSSTKLTFGLSYSRASFAKDAIEKMLADLRDILERLTSAPDQTVAALLSANSSDKLYAPSRETDSPAFADVYERSNLTYMQFAFWMAQRLQPSLPLFNMASLIKIPRQLDPKLFAQAFQTLVNSSDALRTVIDENDGMPIRRILQPFDYDLEYLDFSSLPSPAATAREWAEQRCRLPLDMTALLFDSALIKLSDHVYAWYLNHHQIVSDAWSATVICRRQSELYERAEASELPQSVELPQFAAYVAHERKQQGTPRHNKAEAYWNEKLARKPEPLEFYGRPVPPMTARVTRVVCELGMERTRRLKEIAALKEITAGWPTASLLNIFAALLVTYLFRITGNKAFAIGTPFHNRHSIQSMETIGTFMEVLVLRAEIDPNETFLSLTRKLMKELFESAKHGGYPIRNSLQSRAYDVFLNYHNSAMPLFAGSAIESIWLHPDAGNETLTLQVHDFNKTENLTIDLDFDCDVFDAEQRTQATQHFLQVIDAFIEDHHRTLQSVKLLSEAERQRILVDFNRTDTPAPLDRTYPLLFEEQVRKTPDKSAVEFEEQSLTYQQLNARANRLARQLQKSGVGPEDVVALLCRRNIDLLTAIIGVMKAGAAYLPLDPSDPSGRHIQLLRQSKSVMALASEEFVTDLTLAVKNLPVSERPAVKRIVKSGRFGEKNLPCVSVPKSLAYVIYTSGSSGTPKGVMIEQAGLINHIFAKLHDTGMTPDDTLSQIASQCFDSSVWQFLGPLLIGAKVRIFNDTETRDPVALLSRIEDGEVTVVSTVPSMLRAMLETIVEAKHERWKLPKVKCMLEMGEALPADLCRQWMKLYPQQRMINAYGLTECSDDLTHYVVEEIPPEDQVRVPIGKPLANARFYVLDRDLEPVPVGVIGDLYVGGIVVGRGYVNDPQRTSEVFVPDPFSFEPGSRLYKSGDLARYLPNGDVDYLGRLDFQVKVRGFRIEFGEIESALRQHPAVKESAVAAVDDDAGQKQLVGYVVLGKEQTADVEEIRAFITNLLPSYMVPLAIVELESLPLNSNGKTDRKALPKPDLCRRNVGAYVAPRNHWELQLAKIWQQLLGLERVGVTQNFFDLGGHSLLAVRLLAQIRKRIGYELPLASLIEAGTIERLAAILMRESGANKNTSLVPIQPSGSKLPFFCVHPGSGNVLCYLPLAQQMGFDRPFYGFQDPNTLPGNELQEQTDFEVPLEEMAARYVEKLV